MFFGFPFLISVSSFILIMLFGQLFWNLSTALRSSRKEAQTRKVYMLLKNANVKGSDNMDKKQIIVIVASVAFALFVLTATALSSTPVTPLYTFRMEQQSNDMHFLPTAVKEIVYTTEKGYTIGYDAAGCSGVHLFDTGVLTCYYSTCGGDTCYLTCPESCHGTCNDPTCPDTCPVTCNPTCDDPTCANTCGDTHWNTCEETCEHTCPVTCDDITCLETCSGYTCWETCPDTCPITCEGLTCLPTCSGNTC